MIEKIHVLLKCEHCHGKSYLFVNEAEDYQGRRYGRYKPCPRCQGSGMSAKWVTLAEFQQLLEQSKGAKELASK